MDLLINYPGFKSDIAETFAKLIEDFNLELIVVSDGMYLLKGENCNIRFTFDRGDVFCDIKQPSETYSSQWDSAYMVANYLHPLKKDVTKTDRIYDPKLQLKAYANLIENKLMGVLNGDFSWLPEFKKQEDIDKKIFSHLLNLEYYNPISVKFRKGDETWKGDLEKYLKGRNVTYK